MKLLVTGGAGFIGSHSVEVLLEQGHDVSVLDNLATGRLENLRSVKRWIHIVEGDIRNRDLLMSLMQSGCYDGVLHLAAVASVLDSVRLPLKSHEVNLTGALNVLEAARQTGAKRVVLASSAAVYGPAPEVPTSETILARVASPYAAQKLAVEAYAQTYNDLYQLETVSLRYFNVYGPRQDPSSPYSGVISIFLHSFRRGAQPVIFGDGRQTRDFVYVRDVAQANLLALTAKEARGQCINVGTGVETSILQIAQTLSDIAGSPFGCSFGKRRPGDPYRSCADIEKLRVVLGFQPRHSLGDGLQTLFDYDESRILPVGLRR